MGNHDEHGEASAVQLRQAVVDAAHVIDLSAQRGDSVLELLLRAAGHEWDPMTVALEAARLAGDTRVMVLLSKEIHERHRSAL